MAKLKITLTKSKIGRIPTHVATIKALGLGKMNSSVIHEGTPEIKGMIDKVKYMVKVEEV